MDNKIKVNSDKINRLIESICNLVKVELFSNTVAPLTENWFNNNESVSYLKTSIDDSIINKLTSLLVVINGEIELHLRQYMEKSNQLDQFNDNNQSMLSINEVTFNTALLSFNNLSSKLQAILTATIGGTLATTAIVSGPLGWLVGGGLYAGFALSRNNFEDIKIPSFMKKASKIKLMEQIQKLENNFINDIKIELLKKFQNYLVII